jgi:diadenylate cyclase
MINVSAIIQIAILYLVIHAILKTARGSRFGQVLMGVGILAGAMAAFTFLFHFDVLSRIVHALLAYLAISTVVIFQPEIRRILSTVGAFGYLDRPKHANDGSATPEFVVDTILSLSEKKMGALIAFERGISLRGYEDTGVITNAVFSEELVTCIFTPPMPLHDGGMTIRGGRISAAHCVFPVSNNPALINRGLRHRAAVGLSEETDALVVVVSEETGSISVAHNGKIFRYDDEERRASLLRWIVKTIPRQRRNALFLKMQNLFLKGIGK